MESGLMDADIALEDVWADLEETLGDKMPERIYSEDHGWFSFAQYRERYNRSDKIVRRQLDQWIDDGLLDTQIQRRGRHNIRCYRAVKGQPGT